MNAREKQVERFKAWVAERGGEVLIPTNEYEVVRFRAMRRTSIIYSSRAGNVTYVGDARKAWDAFVLCDKSFRFVARAKADAHLLKREVVVRTLIARDGNLCFYCGVSFCEVRPTKEHLVPITAGGPDHIGNIFLACEPCNRDVGHRSAPEKIRYRDLKRRGVGTTLLIDLRPHVEALSIARQPNGPNYLTLLSRIDAITNQQPQQGTTNGRT